MMSFLLGVVFTDLKQLLPPLIYISFTQKTSGQTRESNKHQSIFQSDRCCWEKHKLGHWENWVLTAHQAAFRHEDSEVKVLHLYVCDVLDSHVLPNRNPENILLINENQILISSPWRMKKAASGHHKCLFESLQSPNKCRGLSHEGHPI